MSTEAHVIGIDPGPTPGLVSLYVDGGQLLAVEVVQCSVSAAEKILRAFVEAAPVRTIVQLEKFVVGRGSMRAAGAGAVTLDLVGHLTGVVVDLGRTRDHIVQYAQRPATAVKPWATDARLLAAGLASATSGMRHARDAARHALFAAVHDGVLADPLSKDWRS